MSKESKGSRPGLSEKSVNLNTTINPTTSPQQALDALKLEKQQSCHRHRFPSSGSLAGPMSIKEELDEEETISISPNDTASKDDSINGEASYPEGGLRAWLVVLGSFSGMMAGFGYMNTIATYQAYISTHQLANYSESATSWIFSVYIFLSFFCGVQIGPVFDAYGPRWLVAAGSALLIASVFLIGISVQYWHFMLAFGLLGGLGTSLVFTPAVSAIGHWFLIKRANATGVATAGGSLGGVIFPLILQRLIDDVGWTWATRVQGFVFVFLLIIANLCIRSRLAPKLGGSVLPDFRIFGDASFLLVTIGTYFLEWGLFSPVAYLISYAISTNAMSLPFAFQTIAIFNAASCFGRWIPGYIADKIGRYNTMVITIVICMLSALALWLPASIISTKAGADSPTIIGLLIAFCVLMGFGSGSNISLTPVCVSMLCDTAEYGRYYATCYTIVSFGTLTGLPIAGAIISTSGGSYWGVALFTGLNYVCALGCYGAVRVLKAGWRPGAIF